MIHRQVVCRWDGWRALLTDVVSYKYCRIKSQNAGTRLSASPFFIHIRNDIRKSALDLIIPSALWVMEPSLRCDDTKCHNELEF